MSAPDPEGPRAEPTAEGLRLAEGARALDLPLRLIGGVAVWVRCPSATLPGLARTYGDVDVVILSSSRQKITAYLNDAGYVPDKLFNAIHGAQRLNFMDPVHQRPLDVLVDHFSMCHAIDLRRRLTLEPLTIPVADLLLTKLQVVELNPKDVKDIVALLADHAPAGIDGDGSGPAQEPLDVARLVGVLGADWGFEHTAELNLAKVKELVGELDLPTGTVDAVRARVDAIISSLRSGRKTLAWKARAAIGERIRWYELPEDVRH